MLILAMKSLIPVKSQSLKIDIVTLLSHFSTEISFLRKVYYTSV